MNLVTVLAPSILATKFVGKTSWKTAFMVSGATVVASLLLGKIAKATD